MQLVLPLGANNQMRREDFITAPGNQAALDFLDTYPAWPAPMAALYGAAASGKTHLARIWADAAGAHIIEARDLHEAPDAGALVIENVDAVEGFAHEAALFALMARGTPLLLTGRAAPAQWPVQMGDLASRFKSLLGFELGAPDEALLLALAVKLFADRQLQVPVGVVTRLVHGLERSPAAIRDFIARADALALARQKPVNLALVNELMEPKQGGFPGLS